eukprot:TRINITY_DN1218_c0_g2_i1.p1 TRINITY_DN1218_c0_g2~~TRINITY_DN1218_c0_g2_i1.p1  ORF type:complete len:410 (+),score=35.25 TRINITY_DN1218_c0_g2_i1:50-1279(+)
MPGAIQDVWYRVSKELRFMAKGWGELDRRDRPLIHKAFILLTVTEAVLVVAGAAYMMTEEPSDRYGRFLWMLTVVGELFLLYFGCDAVYKENVVLLVVFNIGCAIITTRLWFIFVSEFMTDSYAHEVTEAFILSGVTICQLSYLVLSKSMAEDFGRHVFLTVGAKLHIVNLYKTYQYWLGALKTDVQATAMVLIIAAFYFDLAYPLQITLGVYMFVLILVYIATVRWVQLEDTHYLLSFMVFSLAQPSFSVVGVIKLSSDHDVLRSDVNRHTQIVDGGNETSVAPDNSSVTAALILIYITVGLCFIIRLVMLIMLYRTIKGFGKGLTEALHKTETCAVVRSDADDWGLIDSATGFETYHQEHSPDVVKPVHEGPPPSIIEALPSKKSSLEHTPLERVRATSYAVTVPLE